MRLKLIAVVLFAAVLAATVLVLRQERLEFSHQVAVAHRRIDQTRHELWDQQARIAQHLDVQRLTGAIERARLNLEPVTLENPNDQARMTNQYPMTNAQMIDGRAFGHSGIRH